MKSFVSKTHHLQRITRYQIEISAQFCPPAWYRKKRNSGETGEQADLALKMCLYLQAVSFEEQNQGERFLGGGGRVLYITDKSVTIPL